MGMVTGIGVLHVGSRSSLAALDNWLASSLHPPQYDGVMFC